MKSVVIVTVVAASACIDCTNLPSWHAEACYPGTVVSDKTHVFKLDWTEIGVCCDATPSTTEEEVPSDGKVDCSDVYKWRPSFDYDGTKAKVHDKGSMYEAKQPDVGVPPSEDRIGWKSMGECREGTDIRGCHPDEIGIGEIGELRVCSCCKGCATRDGAEPVCLDDVSKEDCYESWCPFYEDLLNPDRCQEILENEELLWWGKPVGQPTYEWPARVVAPHVDVTFDEDVPRFTDIINQTGVKHFMLAFLRVPDNSEICEIKWAGVQDIYQGTKWLDTKTGEIVYLYDEIRKIRDLGGDVILSFGGSVGKEAADHNPCKKGVEIDVPLKVYRRIIDVLNITAINFDIEGNAILGLNRAGWKWRFEIAKELKKLYPYLQVWWSLPVSGNAGLTFDGETFISDLFDLEAPLDKFNGLTSNYGDSCKHFHDEHTQTMPNMQMCEQVTIQAMAQQLFDTVDYIKPAAYLHWKDSSDVIPLCGSTPMIGLNNDVRARYTKKDAKDSVAIFKETKPIGLYSYWSLNRDVPCEEQDQALATCSGASLQDYPFEYAEIFKGILD